MSTKTEVANEAREILFPTEEKVEEISTEEVEVEASNDEEIVEGAENEGEEGEDEESLSAEAEKDDEESEESEKSVDEIETFHDLAEAIGVDDAWLYDVKIPMPHGKDPVTFGEMKDKFEIVAQQEVELKQLKEQTANEGLNIKETYNMLMKSPLELMDIRSQIANLENRHKNVDWNKLRAENPAEYAALNTEFNQMYQGLTSRAQQLDIEWQNQQQQEFEKIKDYNAKQLFENIPEWKDNSTFSKDSEDISQMLYEYGYNQGEIENVIDWRALKIAHDLLKLKSGKKLAEKTAQKVRKSPKMLKGGAAKIKTKERMQKERTNELVGRAKKGNKQDKLAAAQSLLGL